MHGLAHGQHRFMAALRSRQRVVGQRGTLACRVGRLLGRAVDFLHGGCGFFQAAGLRLHAVGHVLVAHGNFFGATAQVAHLVSDVAHHGAHVQAHLGQCALQLTHDVAMFDRLNLGQVARCNPGGFFQHLFQWQAHHPPDPEAGAHKRGHPAHCAHPEGHVQRHQHQWYGRWPEGQPEQLLAHGGGEPAHQRGDDAGIQDLAVAQPVSQLATGGFFAHGGVQALARVDFVLRGLCAHGQKADDLLMVSHWCGVGAHPVKATVFAAVFDHPCPWNARFNGLPHVPECF